MLNIRKEREQLGAGFLGTLLFVIITWVIFQLHLFLIMWNLCVSTVTGHIVYKT